MSDKEELERYEYQLSQIRQQLKKDPGNDDLKTLEDELQGLVDLMKEAVGASTTTTTATTSAAAPAASTSKSTPHSTAAASSAPVVAHNLKAGEDCMAKYTDGKWYPAKILSVSGAADNRAYSIKYAEYDSTEVVPYADVRPLSASKKRQLEMELAEKEKERKRKKSEKKTETQAMKAQVQAQSQKNWQSFAKKSAKKGVVIPGVKGESIFKSPEDMNPKAKVGVVGSGKGMTAVHNPNKRPPPLG